MNRMSTLRLRSGFTTGGVKLIIKNLTGPSDFYNRIIWQKVRSRVFFGDLRAIECRVIERQGMSPDKGNLTTREILQGGKWAEACISVYYGIH